MDDTTRCFKIFETPAGFCAVAWGRRGVTRLQLPTRTAEAAEHMLRRREASAAPGDPPPPVAAAVAAIGTNVAAEIVHNDAASVTGGAIHQRQHLELVMRAAALAPALGPRFLASKPVKLVAIALANRTARTVWALLKTGATWRATPG